MSKNVEERKTCKSDNEPTDKFTSIDFNAMIVQGIEFHIPCVILEEYVSDAQWLLNLNVVIKKMLHRIFI